MHGKSGYLEFKSSLVIRGNILLGNIWSWWNLHGTTMINSSEVTRLPKNCREVFPCGQSKSSPVLLGNPFSNKLILVIHWFIHQKKSLERRGRSVEQLADKNGGRLAEEWQQETFRSAFKIHSHWHTTFSSSEHCHDCMD